MSIALLQGIRAARSERGDLQAPALWLRLWLSNWNEAEAQEMIEVHRNTILATNTSVISITKMHSKAKGQGGKRFWNPPYLIPLVEVVPGDETAAADRRCNV